MSNPMGDPIAYTAIQPGIAVQTADGRSFATVDAVLADEKVSVFDGIVVETPQGRRFIDADYIGSIYTMCVCTTLTDDQVLDLPTPDHSTVIDIKPPRS